MADPRLRGSYNIRWIGDRVVQNLSVHDYAIKNKSFESTVGIPREAIEDDQYGAYAPLMAQLGQDAAGSRGESDPLVGFGPPGNGQLAAVRNHRRPHHGDAEKLLRLAVAAAHGDADLRQRDEPPEALP